MSDDWEKERMNADRETDVSSGIIICCSIGVIIWAVILMAMGF